MRLGPGFVVASPEFLDLVAETLGQPYWIARDCQRRSEFFEIERQMWAEATSLYQEQIAPTSSMPSGGQNAIFLQVRRLRRRNAHPVPFEQYSSSADSRFSRSSGLSRRFPRLDPVREAGPRTDDAVFTPARPSLLPLCSVRALRRVRR